MRRTAFAWDDPAVSAIPPERPGAGPPDAPLVRLRLVGEARAHAILAGTPLSGDRWELGYPTEGDREALGALLREIDRGRPPGTFGVYEILDAQRDVVLGGIGFHAQPDREGVVEVGYGVVEAVSGRGYASAALQAILVVALDAGVRRVIGRALPSNLASCRVMEKAGMSYEGLIDGYACYRVEL